MTETAQRRASDRGRPSYPRPAPGHPRTTLPFPRTLAAASLLLMLVLPGCRQVDEVREYFRDVTSHEAYARSLASAGLLDAALGQDWIDASVRALTNPLAVDAPYREEGFLAANEASALGFVVDLERGQRLTVEVQLVAEAPVRVFVDLFRAGPVGREPLYVQSADSVTNELGFTVDRDGAYIVRVQPELLRGGQYSVTLRSEASVAFPVAGAGTGQIQSFFGASRDGGRRSHHGVDIFMPRGTPVVAGVTGRVSRVQNTGLGGKVVWLRDREQNQSLYYAHLDSQIVREGASVRAGEVLGLVGNTGNARSTPPHLHFGIYRRGEGPVNPYPFIHQPAGELPTLTADRSRVYEWLRVTVDDARLRSAPGSAAQVTAEVGLHTPLYVDAVSGGFYRVRTPDGRRGFVAVTVTEPTDDALRSDRTTQEVALRASPSDEAPIVERAAAGSEIGVLGSFDGFLLVRGSEGRMGWLRGETRSADDGQ